MNNLALAWRKDMPLLALSGAVGALPFSRPVCHLFLILFLLLWLMSGNWKTKWLLFSEQPALLVFALFSIYFLAGFIYSDDVAARNEMLDRKIFLLLVPLAIGTFPSFDIIRAREWLLRTFTIASAAAVAYSLAFAFHNVYLFKSGEVPIASMHYLNAPDTGRLYEDLNGNWLFFSYLGLSKGLNLHPTYFALFLSVACVFLLHNYVCNKQSRTVRIVQLALLILFSAFIILLASKVVTAVLTIMLVGVAVYRLIYVRDKIKTFAILAICFSMGLLLLVNPVTRYRNIQEVSQTRLSITANTNYQRSTEIRASLWWLGWNAFRNGNLLFGQGSADVLAAMEAASKTHVVTNVLQSNDPHNEFLYLLIGNGFIGFALFTAYLMLALIACVHRKDMVGVALLMLWIAVLLTESALELQKGIVFFSVFVPVIAMKPSTRSSVTPLVPTRAGS